MAENIIKIPITELLHHFNTKQTGFDQTVVSDKCWSSDPVKSRLWNYAQMVSFGKYEIHPEDKESYAKLCQSLENGRSLIIRGKPGSGKTTLTKIISKITYHLKHPKRYQFASVFKIVEEFSLGGYLAIQKYYHGHWIFDDVGRELDTCRGHQANGAGGLVNVMGLILDNQYKNIAIGAASFILSTNCAQYKTGERDEQGKEKIRDQFEDLYTSQIAGRLKHVADVIKINGTNYREKTPIDMISVFPEVLHAPTEEKSSPMPIELKEAMEKLNKKFDMNQIREKRDPKKSLLLTPFEQEVDQLFNDIWFQQHNPLQDGSTTPEIEYEGQKYTRGGFIVMMRENAKRKENNI